MESKRPCRGCGRPLRFLRARRVLCSECRGPVDPLDFDAPALGVLDAEDSALTLACRMVAGVEW